MTVDEAKLIAAQNSGGAADQALKTVGEAFADVKRELTEAWLATPARDAEGREKLWLSAALLNRVEKILRTRVVNGRVAEKEIEALRRKAEKEASLLQRITGKTPTRINA